VAPWAPVLSLPGTVLSWSLRSPSGTLQRVAGCLPAACEQRRAEGWEERRGRELLAGERRALLVGGRKKGDLLPAGLKNTLPVLYSPPLFLKVQGTFGIVVMGRKWSGGRCGCSWRGGWNQMSFKVPSNPNHSMKMGEVSLYPCTTLGGTLFCGNNLVFLAQSGGGRWQWLSGEASGQLWGRPSSSASHRRP